jgi:hypothetical protein
MVWCRRTDLQLANITVLRVGERQQGHYLLHFHQGAEPQRPTHNACNIRARTRTGSHTRTRAHSCSGSRRDPSRWERRRGKVQGWHGQPTRRASKDGRTKRGQGGAQVRGVLV